MIIMEFCCLDVVQAWTLIKLVKSGEDRDIVWLSYNNFYSLGETSLFCHAATDTPFNENSRSSQFNITKAFRLGLTIYNVDVLKSLGVVCYSVNMSLSCCQQVRYDNN